MNTQIRVKRTGRSQMVTLILAVLVTSAVMCGLGCQKKPSPPPTSTQASATTSPVPSTATVETANPEHDVTSSTGSGPSAADASQGDYLKEQATDQRTRAHEQSAVFALSDIKTLLAQKEYGSARDAAKIAVKDYADTKYAHDFVDVLAESENQLAAAKEAQAQLQMQIDQQSEADRLARQERFSRDRDDGITRLNDKDYPTAIYYFQLALKEQDDAEVQSLLEQAIDKSTNPRIAVGDFAVSGDVGLPEAGRSVAEILLTKFDPTKFQLIERSRLSAIMDEKDLTLAGIVDNPKLLAGKKVKGVKYLVLGTVSRLGTLTVSARLVDVASGQIVQTAEIEARDAVALQGRLGELAVLLAMTSEEKQAYLADRDRLAQQEAQREAEDRDAAEASARDVNARQQYWRQRQREAILQRQQHDRDAVVVVSDIKSMIARELFRQAARYARQAILDFSDTPSAMELTDLRAVAEREMIRQALAQKEADEEAQRQAAALEAHMQFSRNRQDGMTAYRRSDYRQAIASFREALRFEDSDEVRDLLRQAQAKLKIDEDRAYADAMDRAGRAMREGRWGDAMEAYQGAMALRKTSESQDGVTAAKKKLQQQAQYLQMLDTANAAVGKGEYKTAWKWIDAATALFPDAPEAKALAQQLGPTVVVRAEVNGKEYSGAKVVLNGKPVKGPTPIGLRLRKGDEQEIEVTIPSKGGKSYLPEKRTIRPLQDGFQELVVQVKEVKLPTKTPEQIVREKKYDDAIQSANDAIADLDYRKAWLHINEAMTTDPAGQEAKDLAVRMGPTLGVKAVLDGKEYAGAQVSINGKVQGQVTPASFRFKKGQMYKVSVAIPAKGGKTYSADEMIFKADENDYTEFSANISEVKALAAPETIPNTKPDVAPPMKPRPTPKVPTTLPDVPPTSKPIIAPTPKLPVETPAEKARKTKYETAVDAAADAIKDEDYKAAWAQIDAAVALYPTGEEAKALAEKLGPTLTVTAELNGKAVKGALVTMTPALPKTARAQPLVTPAGLRLAKGQTYDVIVSIPSRAGKSYTPDQTSIKADKNGSYEFHAVLKEVTEPIAPPVIPASQPAAKPNPTPGPNTLNPANAKYQAALHDAKDAIDKKDYKTAWQQIELALSIVPDGKEARTLAQNLGPTLTVKAMLNDTEYPGARVTINGEPQKDTTPSSFKLKPGETYKIEVTIVKRGKSYTVDSKTITPDKPGNTEFVAVIKEVK